MWNSIYCILAFTFILLGNGSTQVEVQDTSSNRITIENADNLKGVRKDGRFIRFLNGNVRLFQDSMFMYCDTAILDETDLTAYGNVVIIQKDSIRIFADSLEYNSAQRQAMLFRNIVLENGEQRLFTDTLSYDTELSIAKYWSGASLIADKSTLKSKIGTYYVDLNLISFYEQVSVRDSAFHLWADSLLYNTQDQRSIFRGPTRIDQGDSQIYCESGYYLMEERTAVFAKNAQYLSGKKTATADTLRYDGPNNIVEMAGNARYDEDTKEASGDLIRYNEKTEETEIVGNAYYRDQKTKIRSSSVHYDPESGAFTSAGRTSLVDDEMILSADDLRYNEETGLGQARFDVVWKDTVSNTLIYCDSMDFRRKDEFVKAMGFDSQIMLVSVMDGDSLFLAADTLVSSKHPGAKDSFNIMEVFRHVRIYKSDLQAVCDSLSYNTTDSLMSLYRTPYIWSDSTQFSGDTIHLTMKEEQLKRIDIPSGGLIITEMDSMIYNQIKGRKIEGILKDGELDTLIVTGNAESLYFLQDELGHYIGLNKTICSKIRFKFYKNELMHINFYSKPNSTLTPMQNVRLSTARLEKFNWSHGLRPKSKEGLRTYIEIEQESKEKLQDNKDERTEVIDSENIISKDAKDSKDKKSIKDK